MKKKKVSNKGKENTIHSTKQYLGLNQIEGSSEYLIAEPHLSYLFLNLFNGVHFWCIWRYMWSTTLSHGERMAS